jgi:hypothetical protein
MSPCLKTYRGDGPVQPVAPIEVDGDKYFAVEWITDNRDVKRGKTTRREYLVRWVGYGPEHNTLRLPGKTPREQKLWRPDLDAYDYAGHCWAVAPSFCTHGLRPFWFTSIPAVAGRQAYMTL